MLSEEIIIIVREVGVGSNHKNNVFLSFSIHI